jgi:L-fucose isomerase-like protein
LYFNNLAIGQQRATVDRMNVNALSNIANPYIQSLTNAAMSALNSYGGISNSGITGASGTGSAQSTQDSSPQLSPFAQLMSALQQLQQNSPAQYQQATQQIATNLQSASQTALANGNTAGAQQLSTLATDFQNASSNGQLPNVADLAQAMGGHHHHGHHGYSRNSNSSSSQSTNQLLSAYSTGAAQSDALNPMNIIFSTLSNLGVSIGN